MNPPPSQRSQHLNLLLLNQAAGRVRLHLLVLRSLQRVVLRRVLVLPPRLRRQMFARRMDGRISAVMTRISEVFSALVVLTTRRSFAQIFITLAFLRRKLMP